MLTQAERNKIEDLVLALSRAEYDLYTKGAFCWDGATEAKSALNDYLDSITDQKPDWLKKMELNSTYPRTASPYARLFNPEQAQAVTKTGQEFLEAMLPHVNAFAELPDFSAIFENDRNPRTDPRLGDVLEHENGNRYFVVSNDGRFVRYYQVSGYHPNNGIDDLRIEDWKVAAKNDKVIRYGDAEPQYMEIAP